MDCSSKDSGGRHGPSEQVSLSPGSSELRKERVTKDDGRYIIFYTFDDKLEEEY